MNKEQKLFEEFLKTYGKFPTDFELEQFSKNQPRFYLTPESKRKAQKRYRNY